MDVNCIPQRSVILCPLHAAGAVRRKMDAPICFSRLVPVRHLICCHLCLEQTLVAFKSCFVAALQNSTLMSTRKSNGDGFAVEAHFCLSFYFYFLDKVVLPAEL